MTEPEEESPPDQALLARVRRGDEAAFGELYRRHVGGVRRYARLCSQDPHLVEDLTAEVFARTLRLVRGGAGPDAAVRAYLLTILRRVAAQWGAEGRMEQLVGETDQLAPAGRAVGAPSEVLALSRADCSMAARAFRSLPERWRAVLWHTTVENEPVSRVAPLLGLTPNATAVLAFRAREGLRTAYLQAHVSSSLTKQEECREYAGRLGAYARRSSRRRGFRELRRHLDGCARCRSAYLELVDLNSTLRGLVPTGFVAFFAATRIAGGSAGIAAELSPVGAAGAGGVFGKAAVTASFALATGAMAVTPMPVPLPGPGQQEPPAATAEVDPGGSGTGDGQADALHVHDPSANALMPVLPAQRRPPEPAKSGFQGCPTPACDAAAGGSLLAAEEARGGERPAEAAAEGGAGATPAAPETPAPETPAPETPAPETPALETPAPAERPVTPATPSAPAFGASPGGQDEGQGQEQEQGRSSGRGQAQEGNADGRGRGAAAGDGPQTERGSGRGQAAPAGQAGSADGHGHGHGREDAAGGGTHAGPVAEPPQGAAQRSAPLSVPASP